MPAAALQSPGWLKVVLEILKPSLSRLELSFSISLTLSRLKRYRFTWRNDGYYLGLLILALINFSYIPSTPLILLITTAYTLAVLVPVTSQFVLPATPIFSWLLCYFSAGHIPISIRPHIWVTLLPTLESVLYGANISDLLTKYTHPALDVLAWIPYGILHFALPFFVAAALFVFGPPGAVKYFGKIFGFLNIIGVLTQILIPCSPPWYELVHGLTPADYHMGGSPGGLVRIDHLFGTNGYSSGFTNAPIPFGAFPSLHAGTSTMEALFLSHFFPKGRFFYWTYALLLYWSTMYLTHHYLIDVTAGGSLAVLCFYLMMSDEMRAMGGKQSEPIMSSAALNLSTSSLLSYRHNNQSLTELEKDNIKLQRYNRPASNSVSSVRSVAYSETGDATLSSVEEGVGASYTGGRPTRKRADTMERERDSEGRSKNPFAMVKGDRESQKERTVSGSFLNAPGSPLTRAFTS